MKKELKRIPDFDEIVFSGRNKEYGAYVLRRKYNTNVIISLAIGLVILGTTVIIPFLNARSMEGRKKDNLRQIEIKLENLSQAKQTFIPPEPPRPPDEVIQQAKYVPPVVVDSVKPDETFQLMTADEAQIEVQDQDVLVIVDVDKEEVKEEMPEPEVFIVVEEMPSFPGGNSVLLKYISDHLVYPAIAAENNIEGKVTIQFCVTPKGGVDRVTILRGVDPELDAEAIRVVKSLPKFNPGKQGGVPVPVWFQVPITFQLLGPK
jgi:periplasmic protein TonB